MRRTLRALGLLVALAAPAHGQNAVVNYKNTQTTPGSINVTPTTPLPVVIGGAAGVPASVSLDGSLSVLTPAYPQFTDLFSSTLDTTTNWTTNNSGGTTATSSGSLVVSGTTTLSQYGGLSTKQSWTPAGASPQVFGVAVSYNTLAVTNSVRIFGVYTSPGTPTLAAPITDGYVFRLNAAGQLFAEVWAAGTAISSTNITAVTGCTPAAGVPNVYFLLFRTNLTQFGCGSNPAAAIVFVNPVNQTLPISAYSIAGLSNPASAATMSLTALSLSTYAPASVKSAGQAPTINDSALVVTPSLNAAGITPIVSGVAEASHVLKASPGVLFGAYVSNPSASGFLMVFNSTTVPGDGAVTPLECIPVSASNVAFVNFLPGPPENYSTGISAALSSTGCFTKTTSPTGFFHGYVQ